MPHRFELAAHEPIPLLIAKNRDEFYDRPALGPHHWPGQGILTGQDLQAGDTWPGLGIGKSAEQCFNTNGFKSEVKETISWENSCLP